MEDLMRELIEMVKDLGTPTFLDWAPILLSVIAVFVAIYVPSIIAKKQNKIAVFDKLYAAYSQMELIRSFADAIKEYRYSGSISELTRLRHRMCFDFLASFDYLPDVNDSITSMEKAVTALRKSEVQVTKMPLLIPLNKTQFEESNKSLQTINDLLFKITGWVIAFDANKTEETGQYVKQLAEETEAFFKSYSGIIEATLKL